MIIFLEGKADQGEKNLLDRRRGTGAKNAIILGMHCIPSEIAPRVSNGLPDHCSLLRNVRKKTTWVAHDDWDCIALNTVRRQFL
jgi:hypothetical protein